MSDEETVADLKRAIEEERQEVERKRQLRLERVRRHKAVLVADPERYAKYKDKLNEWRRKTKATTRYLQNRRTRLAGRPMPEMCEVCGLGGTIVFDHAHDSNRFRGWLCNACNLVLGMVNDDVVRLEKLIVYLKAHEGE
jgi:hypothetical protein